MKLSDYYEKSQYKPQKPQILAFNNEAKEARMEAKMADLEAKIAHFEVIEEEKSVILGQFQVQQEENGVLSRTIRENNARIVDFEAQMQEKQRLLEEVGTLQRSNTTLDNLYGDSHAQLSELTGKYSTQAHEVTQLRTNIANLEIGQQTVYNEGLNKDTLLRELSTALTNLKEKHEGLANFSDELGRKYTEISEDRDKLDKNNIKLNADLLSAQKIKKTLPHRKSII